MSKKKITFLMSFIHPVYEGYWYFFSKYYDLSLYSIFGNYINKDDFLVNHRNIKLYELIYNHKIFSSIFLFKRDNITIKKNDLIIVGDTFTNSLAYTLSGKNVIYYGEYILYEGKNLKNILFYILGFLFFHNKKIIVPTSLAFKTYSKISKNIFYFPQIYCFDIYEIPHKAHKQINLLVVSGDLSCEAKNIIFLIRNYLEITGLNIHLTLVGAIIEDKNFLSPYKKFLKAGTITYIPFVKKEKLSRIYQSSDIFILPSIRDPIGSVVQEAMSYGCAILVSDKVGASGYVENGKNGFIFKNNNNNDFKDKLGKICENINNFKLHSQNILKEKYRYKNEILMDKLYGEFNAFVNK